MKATSAVVVVVVSGSFTLDHPVDAMLSIMFALLLPWSLMLFPMSFAIAGRSLLLVQIELVADIDASCNATEQLHFAQNIIPNKGYPIGNAEKKIRTILFSVIGKYTML